MRWWLKIIMVFLAMGILYISFVRASLERVINDEKSDSLRKIPITYINSRGEKRCYRLPESGILPSNIFYSIKEFRDNLWIYLTRDKADKLMMMVLINDKRLEEILLMKKNGLDIKIINRQLAKVDDMLAEINSMYRGRVMEDRTENRSLVIKIDMINDFYKFVFDQLDQNNNVNECYE